MSNLTTTLVLLVVAVFHLGIGLLENDFVSITLKEQDSLAYDNYILVDASTDFASIVRSNGLFRAFNASYPNYDWCSNSYHVESPTGLLYVKTPKAASSTTAGIALRIANRLPNAHKELAQVPCKAQVNHTPKYKAGPLYGHRNKSKSFLFSTLRDPAKRAVSRIFFGDVSSHGNEPTDENMLHWLNHAHDQAGSISPGMGGFQLAYLSLTPIREYSAWAQEVSSTIVNPITQQDNMVLNPSAVHANVKQILEQYDFLIVVERFDESLVAMQLLLELNAADIMYLASKHAGEYWMNGKGRCIRLHDSFVSSVAAQHLASPKWYAQNYGDYLLLEAANLSLDLTIERLGQERFNNALDEFLALQERARVKCEELAFFPCASNGNPQKELSSSHCYRKDWGCGYPCLDMIADEFLS